MLSKRMTDQVNAEAQQNMTSFVAVKWIEFIWIELFFFFLLSFLKVFVYTRAMAMFINKSLNSRLFYAPNAYHDLLFECENIRGAVQKTMLDFLSQLSDDVELVVPCTPLVIWEKNRPIFSPVESLVRTIGITLSIGGFVTGLVLILSGGKK